MVAAVFEGASLLPVARAARGQVLAAGRADRHRLRRPPPDLHLAAAGELWRGGAVGTRSAALRQPESFQVSVREGSQDERGGSGARVRCRLQPNVRVPTDTDSPKLDEIFSEPGNRIIRCSRQPWIPIDIEMLDR